MKKQIIALCMAASVFSAFVVPFGTAGRFVVCAEETEGDSSGTEGEQDNSGVEIASDEQLREEAQQLADSNTDDQIKEYSVDNYQLVFDYDYTNYDPETDQNAPYVGEWFKIKDSVGEFKELISQEVKRQDTTVECYNVLQFEHAKVRFTVVFDFYEYVINGHEGSYIKAIHAENLDAKDEDTSMGTLLANAGINTILGMGTVFVMLIVISCIIGLFKYIPVLFAPKKSETEDVTIPMPVVSSIPEPPVMEEVSDDEQLVAVIMAAIAAYEGGAPAEGLVVRSIRRHV